jgi:YD repeat-containing protein
MIRTGSQKIQDAFGNHLDVTYTGVTNDWTLTEYAAGGEVVREQQVIFQSTTTWGTDHASENYDTVVKEIKVRAFPHAENGTTVTTATYQFKYATSGADGAEAVTYGCFGDPRGLSTQHPDTPNPVVPRLHRIILPDGSEWDFTYANGDAGSVCAALKALTLPTGGSISWTYTAYEMPTRGCRAPQYADSDRANTPFSIVEGVASKTTNDANGTSATWTYGQSKEQLGGGEQCGSSLSYKYQQSRVRVTAPDHTQTDHYFSIWDDNSNSTVFSDRSEFGLPYTRAEGPCQAPPAQGEFCLSSVVSECPGGGSCTPKEHHYVRYEGESESTVGRQSSVGYEGYGYRREQAHETVFHEDSNHDSTATIERSHYDGLGHYRSTATTSSWSGVSKTQTTAYDTYAGDVTTDPVTWANAPADTRPAYDPTKPWILTTYSGTSVTYTDPAQNPANATVTTSACFAANGFLRARMTKNPVVLPSSQSHDADVIVRYQADTKGNVAQEDWYGGDQQNVSTVSDLCAFATTPSVESTYRLLHTYSKGALATSTYVCPTASCSAGSTSVPTGGTILKLVNQVIDPSGLVSSASDTADLTTTYTYDALGRLSTVVAPGEADRTYAYFRPGQNGYTRPTVTATVTSSSTGTTTDTFQYDGLGRLIKETRPLPDTTSTSRITTYDAMGRQDSITTWSANPTAGINATKYTYDDYAGRITSLQQPDNPDNRKQTFAYTGSRVVTKQRFIGSSTTPTTVTENYDHLGQLVSIADGLGYTTNYAYDVGGRLKTVTMGAQTRTFTYDNAGFLRSEAHPETRENANGSGITTYTAYDARGHVGKKTFDSPSEHDLLLTYDNAERPLTVSSITPARPIKAFSYGVTNAVLNTGNGTLTDYQQGKLASATRYNYLDAGTIGLTEKYQYRDAAGRLTATETTITKDGNIIQTISQSKEYNDRDLLTKQTYPSCNAVPCGARTTDTVTKSYTNGFLTNVDGYTKSPTGGPDIGLPGIAYAANGLPTTIRWAGFWNNQTLAPISWDKITYDATGLPRPVSIQFSSSGQCNAPILSTQPIDQTMTLGGQPAHLTVAIDNSTSGDWTFNWYTEGSATPFEHHTWTNTNNNNYADSVDVTPDEETKYRVDVTNECGTRTSNYATVAALVPAPTGVQASYVNGAVTITWNVVSGASYYKIERKANGAASELSVQVTSSSYCSGATCSFTDTATVGNTAFVYRVRAVAGGGASSLWSHGDVALTKLFTTITVGITTVQKAHFDEVLDAINKLRAVCGCFSTTATWDGANGTQRILPTTTQDPSVLTPSITGPIQAAHLRALRTAMDTARAAMGVPALSYGEPISTTTPFRRSHIIELQQGAQ